MQQKVDLSFLKSARMLLILRYIPNFSGSDSSLNYEVTPSRLIWRRHSLYSPIFLNLESKTLNLSQELLNGFISIASQISRVNLLLKIIRSSRTVLNLQTIKTARSSSRYASVIFYVPYFLYLFFPKTTVSTKLRRRCQYASLNHYPVPFSKHFYIIFMRLRVVVVGGVSLRLFGLPNLYGKKLRAAADIPEDIEVHFGYKAVTFSFVMFQYYELNFLCFGIRVPFSCFLSLNHPLNCFFSSSQSPTQFLAS